MYSKTKTSPKALKEDLLDLSKKSLAKIGKMKLRMSFKPMIKNHWIMNGWIQMYHLM